MEVPEALAGPVHPGVPAGLGEDLESDVTRVMGDWLNLTQDAVGDFVRDNDQASGFGALALSLTTSPLSVLAVGFPHIAMTTTIATSAIGVLRDVPSASDPVAEFRTKMRAAYYTFYTDMLRHGPVLVQDYLVDGIDEKARDKRRNALRQRFFDEVLELPVTIRDGVAILEFDVYTGALAAINEHWDDVQRRRRVERQERTRERMPPSFPHQ